MTNNNTIRNAAATAIALLLLCCSVRSFAQTPPPFVDPLFTDNMILQRGIPDNVWGWTTPGQQVTVSINKKTATAIAGADGKWSASVGPFKAGGPYTLTVTGPQTVTFANVLIGDVWFCSGQSNMEFGIGNANNGAQEIASANYPNIRIFTVAKNPAASPLQLVTGEWQSVTPDSIAQQGTWNGFSAVGYYFGRDLQNKINVPIGLIQSSWGGTPAEAWTSSDALAKNLHEFSPQLDALAGAAGETPAQLEAGWYNKYDPGSAGAWQDPDLDVSGWKAITLPGYFQQAGIPELARINGIVWFRTKFDLPAANAGKDGILYERVDDDDTTWVNGTQVGATQGVSSQRAYAIPANLLKPTGNVIVVRCLDTGGNGGVYGDAAAFKVAFTGGQDIPLAGVWQYRLAANYAKIPYAYVSNPNYPTELFNGMVAPILQYGIKGALWYQGEANSGNPLQYRTLLPTMIADWRSRWNEGNFPFLIVQLAGWQPGGPSWPELRQAQWLTAVNTPNSGIVTTIDIGDRSSVHPLNKQEVGRRLALLAEATTYGLKVPFSGPVYKAETVEGSTIRVSFTHTDKGLVVQGGAPLEGFEIAGPDGNFVAADAKIDGNTVVVSSPQTPSPIAVQYDWAPYPAGNLYNGAGLPTFPFKTDEK